MAEASLQRMGEVVRYRPPRPREETTATMGMVFFLGGWAMMFAVFFISYGFMRARLTSWPPAGVPELPWELPLVNTVVLALSSCCYQWGVHQVRMVKAARAIERAPP